MSWIEISLGTSPEHEALVDKVHSVFYDETEKIEHANERTGPWKVSFSCIDWPRAPQIKEVFLLTAPFPFCKLKPHISVAYDNPEASVLDEIFAKEIFARFPTLLGRSSRDVLAISLWKTEGFLWDWKCLDRVSLSESLVPGS
jgi:hypothetical protein